MAPPRTFFEVVPLDNIIGVVDARRLPGGQRLEGDQEGEDVGAHRWNQDQEHEHAQCQEHDDNLGGWRQLLEFLQEILEMHRFPSLSIFDIL